MQEESDVQMKHLSSENTTQAPEHKETELEGQIERITYMNEENGYTVAKVNVPGYLEPVTIVPGIWSLLRLSEISWH